MASVRQLAEPSKKTGKRPWVVTYTGLDGKRRQATPKSGLKRDAEKLRIQIENEIEGRVHVAPSETVTIAKAVELYIADCERRVREGDDLRQITLTNYRWVTAKHITAHIGSISLSKLSARDVQNWVDKISFLEGRTYGKPSVQRALEILTNVVAFAQRKGLVVRNVVDRDTIKVPGRSPAAVAVPQKDDLRKIFAEFDRPLQGKRADHLRPIIYLAVFTGLRMGEIRALRWEDVDLQEAVVHVRRGVDRWGRFDAPKTEAAVRSVPIAPAALLRLKEWYMLRGRPSGDRLVFHKPCGAPLCETSLGQSWKRLATRALHGMSLPKKGRHDAMHFHALRHTAAALFIETGLPPKRIQYLMGHKSITTTFDRYGYLFENPDQLKDAVSRMGADLAT